MPKQTAADCDEEIPRELRDLTNRPTVRKVHTWAPDGSRPTQFTVWASHLDSNDLPDGYAILGAGGPPHPNVAATKYRIGKPGRSRAGRPD